MKTLWSYSCLFLLLLATTAKVSHGQSVCTLCADGNDDVVNGTKTFSVEGLLIQDCQELVDGAAFFDADSSECQSIRTWGSYCGCPVPADACSVCQPGLVSLFSNAPLRQIQVADYDLFGATSFTTINCETLDSALNFLAKEGDDLCTKTRLLNNDLQKCACADPTNEGGVGVTDDQPVFFDPNATQPPTPAPVVVCTVCEASGDDATYIDVTKEFRLPGLLLQTCGDLIQAASLFQESSAECQSIRTLGRYCGCPVSIDACSICPKGEISFFPTSELRRINASDYDIFGAPPGTTLNCETLDSAVHYLAKEGDALCESTRLLNNGLQKCACNLPNATNVGITDDQPVFVSPSPVEFTQISTAPQPSPSYGGGSDGNGSYGTGYDSQSGKKGKSNSGKSEKDKAPKSEKEGGAKGKSRKIRK